MDAGFGQPAYRCADGSTASVWTISGSVTLAEGLERLARCAEIDRGRVWRGDSAYLIRFKAGRSWADCAAVYVPARAKWLVIEAAKGPVSDGEIGSLMAKLGLPGQRWFAVALPPADSVVDGGFGGKSFRLPSGFWDMAERLGGPPDEWLGIVESRGSGMTCSFRGLWRFGSQAALLEKMHALAGAPGEAPAWAEDLAQGKREAVVRGPRGYLKLEFDGLDSKDGASDGEKLLEAIRRQVGAPAGR